MPQLKGTSGHKVKSESIRKSRVYSHDYDDPDVSNGFTCDGGRRIAVQYINDGYCDCEDGTDEVRPCGEIVEKASFIPNAYCSGGNVNMRNTPEIIDNVIGLLKKNQKVRVIDDIRGNDPNVGVMNKNYDYYEHGWDEIEEGQKPIKLRKNQAVRIINKNSYWSDVVGEHLVDISITYKEDDFICYGVPKRLITSYYGQTWYRIITEEGEKGWVSGDFIKFF